ncbi:MAG: hypothetical protein ACLUEQ_01915 [Cloacibacillus evryensis]
MLIAALWRLGAGEWDIPAARVAALNPPDEASRLAEARRPQSAAAPPPSERRAAAWRAPSWGLLTNPLAEPYTLGIAAARLGGALGFSSVRSW